MARSRVELFEQIRRGQRAEGSSIRELAGRHHVHRRAVRQALAGAVPPPRKAYPRRHVKWQLRHDDDLFRSDSQADSAGSILVTRSTKKRHVGPASLG